MDLHFPLGRVQLKVVTIDREGNIFVLLQVVETVGQCHFTFAMMVAIALSIGRDVHQLTLLPPVEGSFEPPGKILAVIEQSFKSYRLGDIAIVKKQVNVFSAGQQAAVWAAGVNTVLGQLPAVAAQRAHRFCLPGGQYGKKNARFCQQAQGGGVNGSLCQPHAFGLSPKAVDEILNPPAYLRALVALVGQRHDDVVVHLRKGGTMAVKELAASPVASQDGGIGGRVGQLQPRQQRGPHIEAYLGIVVGNLADVALGIEYARSRIGGVAFKVDALVPVVKRRRAVLLLHSLQPGIFTRRLVEVPMDAYISVVLFHRPLFYTTLTTGREAVSVVFSSPLAAKYNLEGVVSGAFFGKKSKKKFGMLLGGNSRPGACQDSIIVAQPLPRMSFIKTKITFCSIELDIYP